MCRATNLGLSRVTFGTVLTKTSSARRLFQRAARAAGMPLSTWRTGFLQSMGGSESARFEANYSLASLVFGFSPLIFPAPEAMNFMKTRPASKSTSCPYPDARILTPFLSCGW